MKAIGYIRVSTENQATDGVSLEAQSARIAAYCHANGLELAGVFVDAGISGKRADNRPELQAALNAVCKDKAALVVYSLSRLARSVKDTLAISERLERAGADLVSLSEKIDTTSAAGRMVFRMLSVLAEFERDLVSERTKAAMIHLKAAGQRVGTVPFGWNLAADGVSLVPNDAEQTVLATIRQLRTAGQSLRDIASYLNTEGISTKKGRATWYASTVASVLKAA